MRALSLCATDSFDSVKYLSMRVLLALPGLLIVVTVILFLQVAVLLWHDPNRSEESATSKLLQF